MAKKKSVKDDTKDSSKRSFLSRLMFWKRDRVLDDLKKVDELTEKEARKKDLHEKMFSKGPSKAKAKAPRRRRKLSELLNKAGLDASPVDFRKRVFLIALVLSLLATGWFIAFAVVSGSTISGLLVFMAGFWTAGFLLIMLITSLLAAAYLDLLIIRRQKEVEAVLPDFLQLTAANIGAGMTIDKALWLAVRPRFGVLGKEVEDVAKQVLTGRELPDALRDFSARYESPVLERSVNLLLEGIAAGGKVADLLHKISTDIQEQRILRQEMAANVMTYVIFISFAAVIAAPVLFGLATQLLTVIQSIAAGMGSNTGAAPGGLTVSSDVIALADFRLFSILVLVGTSLLSGLIVSVIRTGEMLDGLRYVPFFSVISVGLYFLSVALFGSLFGGLL